MGELGLLFAGMTVVLLQEPMTVTQESVSGTLLEYVPAEIYRVEESEAVENGLLVTYRGQPFGVVQIPEAKPMAELEQAIKIHVGDGDIRAIIEPHKAQLAIFPINEPEGMGEALFNAVTMTQLSAMLTANETPLAAYWQSSEGLVTFDRLMDAASESVDVMSRVKKGDPEAADSMPIFYWVGHWLYSHEGKNGATSKGLAAFTGYEIQFRPTNATHPELSTWLYGIVHYVMSNGPILASGNTLELAPDRIFELRLEEATERHGPFMLLEEK